MKTSRLNRGSEFLHIETEGAVINIRENLTDRKGRPVVSIEILPYDHYEGEPVWRTYPGVHNVRVVKLKKKFRGGTS